MTDRNTCPLCGWWHPVATMVADHIRNNRCGREPDTEKAWRARGK